MALIINKFFASRKKAFSKNQDVCERTLSFSEDQVRVVLFRECDFRGRKLLFDSQSVQKVLLPSTTSKTPPNILCSSPQYNKNEVYVEMSNGYGYQYTRPIGDIVQLGEMVFGTVAMSFRGTSLKIHSFTSPPKLMCTQVFPTPRHPIRGRISVSSQHFDPLRSNSSAQSFDKSAKFDYSSASSTTSFTEQTSMYSTESDVKISTSNGSVPLDVPASNVSMTSTKLAPSLEGDSGFCGEQSYSSLSSGPPSMSLWDSRHENANLHGFSCGSLYKRWLRSASTSLDYNGSSDTSLAGGVQSSASADECMTRNSHRSSKLGLAVIIHLSEGQEIELERYLLEHSALIEAMVCRARSGTESAYTKPANFASLMFDVFRETSRWLVDLITGPTIGVYLWHTVGQRTKAGFGGNGNCDNSNRLISGKNATVSSDMGKTKSESCLAKSLTINNVNRTKCNLTSSLLNIDSGSSGFRSILRPLNGDIFSSDDKTFKTTNNSSLHAEKFLREFCELLESADTKHTNFFISTLLTAVLTHHLGWVSTVLPPSQTDKETLARLHSPCNPLWGQLSDLYGAVGSPTKVAHTILCGSNKSDIITKILYTLTYFIRCSVVERHNLARYSLEEENLEAEIIYKRDKSECEKTSLFDHCLKTPTRLEKPAEKLEMSTLNLITSENKNGLTRIKSCANTLKYCEETTVEDSELSTKHPLLDKVTSLGLGVANSCEATDIQLFNCLKTVDDAPVNLVDIAEASDQIRKVFHSKIYNNGCCKPMQKEKSYSSLLKLSGKQSTNDNTDGNVKPGVIFVLGDNDELVGLKKSQLNNNQGEKVDQVLNSNIPSCSTSERPKDLKIPNICSAINKKLFDCDDSSDSSPDSPSCKRSTSLDTSPCSECDNNQRDLKITQLRYTLLASSSSTSKRNHSILQNEASATVSNNKLVMTRSSVINLEEEYVGNLDGKTDVRRRDEFNRSQSVPPSDKSQRKCSKNGCKKKYSGVKFDFKQYPQIVTNYMKSKNLEMSQMPFADKAMKLNRSFSASLYDCSKYDFPSCDCEPHSEETLQTPSNASELEFSSELVASDLEKSDSSHCQVRVNGAISVTEDTVDFAQPLQQSANKENNAIFEHDIDTYENKSSSKEAHKMSFVELPLPRITAFPATSEEAYVGYTKTLFRGVNPKYISDMVLQGTLQSPKSWEHILRRDLILASRKPLLDQPVQEAVAIVANTDTWEVHLVSSHTYVVEKGSSGIRVGMSQLVANMLETLLHMWKLRTPPEYCLMHIESRLREFCLRSNALAHLLLTTEFCNMDLLTSSMQLEVNDVPLLMAVASTHSPQVTQQYGLSFQ